MIDRDIKAYAHERNAMLRKVDVAAMMAFMAKHQLPLPPPHLREQVLHQTITGVVSLPLRLRKASKAWLTERGYHSLDDGEL